MHLFRLDSSIRTEGSISRAVGDSLLAQVRADDPTLTVVHRDLGTAPLPYVWPAATSLRHLPEGAPLSPEQQDAKALVTTLAEEVIAADALVLDVPLYNFGIPVQVKLWLDLLQTDPRLGTGKPETLAGTPVFLVLARGGGYGAGTPRDGWDHNTPYLRRILVDVLHTDVTVIEAELTLAEVNPAMAELRGLARELEAAAHARAGDEGRALVKHRQDA